jgi:hypothetical protein
MGNFETGSISQWLPNSGGAQCANYGVPSANYHARGTFSLDSSVVGDGQLSGRVDLPPTAAPYTTSVCELLHSVPLGLGSDEYYGFMFYVPVGWDTGTNAFWGVQVAQFHFTNVWGSPVAYQLHDDHLTLALETGSCDAVGTANPSCDWRSQADLAGGPNLPGYYVIPPGSMPQGHWYETIMHVHWAADSTGQIQTWFRQKGQSAWTQSVDLAGYPTVLWDRTAGCCATGAVDKVGAYRGPSSVPVSVWFDDVSEGSGFASVAGSMP